MLLATLKPRGSALFIFVGLRAFSSADRQAKGHLRIKLSSVVGKKEKEKRREKKVKENLFN